MQELLLCPGLGMEEAVVMERGRCVLTWGFGVLADWDVYLLHGFYGVGP